MKLLYVVLTALLIAGCGGGTSITLSNQDGSLTVCCDDEHPPPVVAGTFSVTADEFRPVVVVIRPPEDGTLSVSLQGGDAELVGKDTYRMDAAVEAVFEVTVTACFEGSRAIAVETHINEIDGNPPDQTTTVDVVNEPKPDPQPDPNPDPEPDPSGPTFDSEPLVHDATRAFDFTTVENADVIGVAVSRGLCVALDDGTFGVYELEVCAFFQSTRFLDPGLIPPARVCGLYDGPVTDGIFCGIGNLQTQTLWDQGYGQTLGESLLVLDISVLPDGTVRIVNDRFVQDRTTDATTGEAVNDERFFKGIDFEIKEMVGAYETSLDVFVVFSESDFTGVHRLGVYDTQSPTPLLGSTTGTGGDPLAFAGDGNFCCASFPDQNEVRVFDVGDRANPALAGSVAVPMTPRDVEIKQVGPTFHVYAATEDGVYHFSFEEGGAIPASAERLDMPAGLRCDFVHAACYEDGTFAVACNDLDAALVHVMKDDEPITSATDFPDQ